MRRGSRADALAQVAKLWRAPRDSCLLIVGEAGVGKSSLLENIVAATDSHVELVRVNPAESGYAFSGFGLFDEWLGDELRASAAASLTDREPDASSHYAAANQILEQVRSLNLPPTFVVIDDIDLMDHDSQVVVGLNVARLNGTGVRFVATATDVDGNDALDALPQFALEPFSTEELVDLALAGLIGGDEATLRIVAGHAGGNPRIFLDLLAQLDPPQRNGRAPITMAVPVSETLDRVVRKTVSALSQEERAMVEKVAVAPIVHTAALTGQDRHAVDLLEDLIGASVLTSVDEWVDIVDPRVRIHLHAAMGARVRNAIHEELAQSADPLRQHLVVWHRSFSSPSREDVDGLLTGALWLVRMGRIAAAVEFADRALSRVADAVGHAAPLLDLCIELLRRGELGLAARYVAWILPDAEIPAPSMTLAVINLASHMFDGSVMVDADVQSMVRLHGASDTHVAVAMLVIAAYRRAERWEISEARAFMASADQIGDKSADSIEAVRVVKAILDALEGMPAQANGAEIHSLGTENRFIPEVMLLQSRLLTYREQYAEARTVISAARLGPRHDEGSTVQTATLAQIANEVAAGEFRLALAAMSDLRTLPPIVSRRTAAHAYYRAWVAYALGRVETATAHLESCFEFATDEANHAMRARALALRGAMGLMSGEPESAVGDLRQVSVLSNRFPNPALLRHTADYVEACVLTDRFGEAKAAFERLESQLAHRESRWGELALMRCSALVATDEKSLELFAASVNAFGPDEDPYELGRTLLAMAERQTALGDESTARRSQIAAFTAFDRSGASGWVARAEHVAVPRNARTRVLDQFNDEQREIIRRVVRGQSTREIAGSVHLSVRTVELRLTAIYRGLGVASRGELIARLSK